MKYFRIAVLSFAVLSASVLWAEAETSLNASAPDGIRPGGTLADETKAPDIPETVTPIKKPMRNYPDQPPTIPHSVEGYQVDRNYNQCLSCHSRARSPDTGAPMVSITHYLDRDHQALAAVSPRRYFCVQCHVPQHAVEPVTSSNFQGIEKVLEESLNREVNQSENHNNGMKAAE
ncbi:cytochrome C [Aestuariicella hydrocarbonica]|uniref:Periplasmic nitrate reductase, electron transfer subunit n=2 Tax=Pseudomaricurvus hydrocarbonicus TaxID=1470433 RepID=A0A9E5JTW0_9GAMM|nr:cytochrome C [Aestuariicella hydrocarbonica]